MPTNDIHINPHYSASVDEIIGVVPGRFLYSGITMIAMVALTAIALSYFIKYPDKIQGQGMLTSESPPIEVICQIEGIIDTVFKENSTTVNAGESLLFIKSTTNVDQLQDLLIWMKRYELSRNAADFLKLDFPNGLQLGDVQGYYADLQIHTNQLRQILRNNLVDEQVAQLTREIDKIRDLNASSTREKNLFDQELKLVEKNHQRQQKLLKQGVVSKTTFEDSESQLLEKRRTAEGLSNSLIRNDIRIEQLNLEKIKLNNQHKSEIKTYRFKIEELITKTKAIIGTWSNSYQLESPISGQLMYLKGIVPKRSVVGGQQVAYIIPDQNEGQFMQVGLPASNIGKVEAGLKAIIKFDAFPHKEYGMIESKVGTISRLPEIDEHGNALYEVIISLPRKIITNYGKEIPYKPQMSANVEIITTDKSILERVLNQFLSLVK